MKNPHIFTVHINPSRPTPYEDAEFIEEGFSWTAFFFGGLWALYYQLWWQAAAIITFNIFMFNMGSSHYINQIGVSIIGFCVQLLIGFSANDWRRAKLKHTGFITADIVIGDSLLRAEQRFFDRYFAGQTPAPLPQ